MSTSEHAGRSVVITGAADGMGAALARRFAELGAGVTLGDRDETRLEALVADLRGEGFDATGVTTDVTSSDDNQRLIDTAVGTHGGVHVLIIAAGGYTQHKPSDELTDEEWDQGIAVNLSGAFRTARAAIPAMKEAGEGRMVFFSSTAGRMPTPAGKGIAYYAAAKAGLLGLTRHLAVELGPYGINVNAVAPGTTLTPRVDALRSAEEVERIAAQVPLRRIASVEDQLGPILFLSSQASAYMTGATLDVNGGRIML